MTEIYKIEDEFSTCDKDCKYLNTCIDTYVDYYKNINPYDTQLILAKSNIGNEINDMEETDYLDYFDQNFDKVDNLYTDLILKPKGMKKKILFEDQYEDEGMGAETIDAEELTPDFDKINYSEQPKDDGNDNVNKVEDYEIYDNRDDDKYDGRVENKNIAINDGRDLDIQNINNINETVNELSNETNNNVNETNNNVNETVNNVNETVNNVNENVNETTNNVNETVDNTNKPVTTNIDARTTNIYNPEEEGREEQRENQLINKGINEGIKPELSDFSLRENEGKIKENYNLENKIFKNENNIIPLENGENLHREKIENTEKIPINKELIKAPQEDEIFEKPEGKFEYNPQRSNLRKNKPERSVDRPADRPADRPNDPIREEKQDDKNDKNDKQNISISLDGDSGSGMPPMMYPGSSGDPRMMQQLQEKSIEIGKLKKDLENANNDTLGKNNMDRMNKLISDKDERIDQNEKEIAELNEELKQNQNNNSGVDVSAKDKEIDQLKQELENIKQLYAGSEQKCEDEKAEQMKFLEGIYNHLNGIEGKCDNKEILDNIKIDQDEITTLIEKMNK